MRNRRSQYDVTNQVDVSDAFQVRNAVLEILRDIYPNLSASASTALKAAFEDCHKLFEGENPNYLPCDTLYHDKQHSLDMTLALSRLISGHERTASLADRLGAERAILGIITALYHDSGYIRHINDPHHKNGAEYTRTHVSRSADFLKKYLNKIGHGEYAKIASNMVHYTGYEVAPDNIHLPDDKTHLVGHMLGTADLIAQMSDRCYLEKCRDRLFPEFVLGGMAVQIDANGNEKVIYESGIDLLRKTPLFFANEVEDRLNNLFNKVYNFETVHFDGERKYIHALGQNQAYLKKILKSEDFDAIRREAPENYGTRNFPGLDEYLNHKPKKRQTQ